MQRFDKYGGIFIPVLSNEDKKADFITIDKNNTNDFSLHETGRVNYLLVENLSNKPLLILNGEIFDGAKQDRVANETALVPANSSLEIKEVVLSREMGIQNKYLVEVKICLIITLKE